jgi:hypothetical protein
LYDGDVDGLLDGDTIDGMVRIVIDGSNDGSFDVLRYGLAESIGEGAFDGTNDGLSDGEDDGAIEGLNNGTFTGIVE